MVKHPPAKEKRHPIPAWVDAGVMDEHDLCSICFKAVGVKSRYQIICELGKSIDGATVGKLTDKLGLRQPTVTHHLNILRSVDALLVVEKGRERIYKLNRQAHCFEDCKIPY